MRRVSFAHMNCPIARTLDLVGDWWTLLILRDVIFWRRTRFDELRDSLGITASVLTDRLRSLTEAGLLERRDAPKGRSPHEYLPTRAALDLLPVLLALVDWGTQHIAADLPRIRTCHVPCGAVVEAAPWCPRCVRRVASDELRVELAPAHADE